LASESVPSRAGRGRAKSPSGIIVEEEEKVWLSEFGRKNLFARVVANPWLLSARWSFSPAKTYDAEIAYAVLRPGDRSRVHTHPGPEAGM